MEIVGNDTGFENDQQIDGIDFENEIHPPHRHHDAAGNGDCATGITDTASTRNHRNGFAIRKPDNLGNLFRIFDEDDDVGRMKSLCGIGAVFPNGFRIGAHMLGAHNAAKLFQILLQISSVLLSNACGGPAQFFLPAGDQY